MWQCVRVCVHLHTHIANGLFIPHAYDKDIFCPPTTPFFWKISAHRFNLDFWNTNLLTPNNASGVNLISKIWQFVGVGNVALLVQPQQNDCSIAVSSLPANAAVCCGKIKKLAQNPAAVSTPQVNNLLVNCCGETRAGSEQLGLWAPAKECAPHRQSSRKPTRGNQQCPLCGLVD